jgi:ABC-type antimicrobial peptide transport system permease subunit
MSPLLLSWWDDSAAPPNEAYLWDIWYSFVLNDPREHNAFVLENQAVLAAMGLNLLFIENDADNFWASADNILQSITINAVLFWVVLFLVFALVVFLFIQQRHREIAIARALGMPAKKISAGLIWSLTALALPAIMLGSALGWAVLDGQVNNILRDLDGFMGAEVAVALPPQLLLLLAGVALALIFIMISFGLRQSSRRPVLELLQGNKVKGRKGGR